MEEAGYEAPQLHAANVVCAVCEVQLDNRIYVDQEGSEKKNNGQYACHRWCLPVCFDQ